MLCDKLTFLMLRIVKTQQRMRKTKARKEFCLYVVSTPFLTSWLTRSVGANPLYVGLDRTA